jgi:Holliday junction resolvase RusA-like endonuclease
MISDEKYKAKLLKISTTKENSCKLLFLSFNDILPEPYSRPRKGKNNIFYNPRGKYKTKVRNLIKERLTQEENFNVIEDEVNIKIYFRLPKPKFISDSRLKSDLANDGIIKPKTRPDLDNYAKPILDALNGIVYKDDGQITELLLKKIYSDNIGFDIVVNYYGKLNLR